MVKRILLAAAGFCVIALTPVHAATYQFSTEVDSSITTGDVSISLNEYEAENDGSMLPYADGKVILPNQRISKIIAITNEAKPAWIRAKVQFMSYSGIEGLEDSLLGGISDTWVYQGGYYYYTEPVGSGETVNFFKEVAIPSTWDESYANKGFEIDITAQAVQKANFTPDFNDISPWFGVPIEQCIHTDHELYHAEGNTEFAIIFENGVDGFIQVEEDFFAGFSAIMPGDTLTDSFRTANHFSKQIPIYFRTEIPGDQTEEALQLMDVLTLIIKRGDEIIYEGPLHADSLAENITLATLGPGSEENISFSLFMPPELTNSYAMRKARVRWIFSTEYTTSSGGRNHSSVGSGADPGNPNVNTNPDIGDSNNGLQEIAEKIVDLIQKMLPKTGDASADYRIYATISLSCACMIFLLLSPWIRHKKTKEENQNKEEQHASR